MFRFGGPERWAMAPAVALLLLASNASWAQQSGGRGGRGIASGRPAGGGHFSGASPSSSFSRANVNHGAAGRGSVSPNGIGHANFNRGTVGQNHSQPANFRRGNLGRGGFRGSILGFGGSVGVYPVFSSPGVFPWGFPSIISPPDYSSYYFRPSADYRPSDFNDYGDSPSENIVPQFSVPGGIGNFVFGGTYVPPDASPTATPTPNDPRPEPALARGVASFSVSVPPDAELLVEGQRTKQTGSMRLFESPPVVPGADFKYQITARWRQGGRMVEQTRSITFRAGDRFVVNFAEATPRPAATRSLR